MELCKKDLDYAGRMEQDSLKDVKKTPNMKLPLHFYSTFEKVTGAALTTAAGAAAVRAAPQSPGPRRPLRGAEAGARASWA